MSNVTRSRRRTSGSTRGRRRGGIRNETGAAGVWLLLVTVGIFPLALGLVVDGGATINNRVEAKRAAEQAARGAADELSVGAVRSGSDAVNADRAAARAQHLLSEGGWTGTVSVAGNVVRVHVTGPPTKTKFLKIMGVDSFPVDVTGAATAITTPDG